MSTHPVASQEPEPAGAAGRLRAPRRRQQLRAPFSPGGKCMCLSCPRPGFLRRGPPTARASAGNPDAVPEADRQATGGASGEHHGERAAEPDQAAARPRAGRAAGRQGSGRLPRGSPAGVPGRRGAQLGTNRAARHHPCLIMEAPSWHRYRRSPESPSCQRIISFTGWSLFVMFCSDPILSKRPDAGKT